MATLLYIEINHTLQTLVLEDLGLNGDMLSISRDQVGLSKDLSLPVIMRSDGYYICSFYLDDKYSSNDKIMVHANDVLIQKPILFEDHTYYDVTIDAVEKNIQYRLSKVDLSRQNSGATIYKLPKAPVRIGCTPGSEICVKKRNITVGEICEIGHSGGKHYVECKQSKIAVYKNGYEVSRQELDYGDMICTYDLRMIYLGDCILVYNQDVNVRLSAMSASIAKRTINNDDQGTHLKNRVYSRNPRIVDSLRTESVRIDPPPRPEQQKKMPAILQVGPSLTMALAMVVTLGLSISSAIGGGSLSSVITSSAMCVAMLLGSVLWPVLSRRHQEKQAREAEQLRHSRYGAYLAKKEGQIQFQTKYNSDVLGSLYLSSAAILQIMEHENDIHKHLFNKLPTDADFLRVRLGAAELPSCFDIEAPEESFTLFDDTLMDNAIALKKQYETVPNMPLILDLKQHKAVGVVGKDRMDIIQNMILALTFTHSYEDVKCAFIHHACDGGKFQWCKNLPHTHSDEGDTMYIACNTNEAHILMCDIARSLESDSEESGGNESNRHYVIFVFGKQLIENESLTDKFIDPDSELAVTVVYIGENITDLPGECTAMVYREGGENYLYLKEATKSRKTRFTPELVDDVAFVKYIQKLSIYKLNVRTRTAGIPSSVTFLDMFKVGNIHQLNIAKRWEESDASRTMAVPVGVKAGGDLLYLDMHESAHGPHGLVAGMTGSGKSEMIQSLVLSLAVNFHPDEVSLVIVDFKGGGMADAFVGIPHIAGKITNLSGAELSRAMISIDAELKRRQILLQQAGKEIFSIDMYSRLRKSGRSDLEPLPHLIIVVDEFAQLKAQHPEFMRKLIDVAQIGRSLGVHLILATQKPSGIVDDQIWGNSRFRLCLKVLQKQDSVDLIRRPDAARIKLPGRTYLQVGYDEVFDCFQSGYSGCTYREDKVYRVSGDNVVSLVNSLGNVVESREVLTKEEMDNKKNKLTQLRAIVNHIVEIGKGLRPHTLWEDPMADMISLNEIVDPDTLFDGVRWKQHPNLSTVIGKIDDPAQQTQSAYSLDLENGNVGIYGMAESGLTLLLQTMLYGLCVKYSPEQLRFHIFDFGGRTLGIFDSMPHIRGKVIYADNESGVQEQMKEISELIAERKKLFGKLGVTSLTAFNKSAPKKIPAVVIVVDNYSGMAEFSGAQQIAMSAQLLKFAREGNSYGVYCIYTGANRSAMGTKVPDFLPQVISMRMADKNAYRDNLKVPVSLEIAEYVGRGVCLIGKTPVELQAATVDGIRDDYDRSQQIKKVGLSMKSVYTGEKTEVDHGGGLLDWRLQSLKHGCHLGNTPAGVRVETFHDRIQSLVVTGNKEDDLYRYVSALTKSVAGNVAHVFLLDGKARFKDGISDWEKIEHLLSKMTSLPKDERKLLVIPDFKQFVEQISDDAGKNLIDLFKHRAELNLIVIIADLAPSMSILNHFSTLKTKAVLVFIGNDVKHQLFIPSVAFPTYDDEILKTVSGVVYDYTTEEIKFIVL